MPKCKYGCGQEATHQFDNGEWACADKWNKCPARKTRKAYKKKRRPILIPDSKHICKCGKPAIWYYKVTDTYWCSDNVMKCKKTADKISSIIEDKWKDPNCREKYETALRNKDNTIYKIAFNKPEIRQNRKRIMNERYNDPIERQIQSERMKLVLEDENIRKKIGLASRLRMIKQTEERLKEGYQIIPNFNPNACALIDEYGNKHGYEFQHAMNGGEYYIKELGYWVDGYDIKRNTVIEVDEPAHFDADGNLSKKDIRRQKEIEEYLGCDFIRLKI